MNRGTSFTRHHNLIPTQEHTQEHILVSMPSTNARTRKEWERESHMQKTTKKDCLISQFHDFYTLPSLGLIIINLILFATVACYELHPFGFNLVFLVTSWCVLVFNSFKCSWKFICLFSFLAYFDYPRETPTTPIDYP